MKPKIKFGIIGCSSISKKSTIPSICSSKLSEIEIIGSRNSSKAKSFTRIASCKKSGTYEEVLENDNVDAVYLSLPMSYHEEWILKAAKAGKHILCEKSAVLSAISAKKIIKSCKNNNVRILENFVFKNHPQHKIIKNLIHKNKIGKIRHFHGKFGFNLPYSKKNFRFNKKLGGGALNDVGCYLISASMFIFELTPIEILCSLEINKKLDIDMSGHALLKFPNDQSASISFGYNNYFQSMYEVWGTKGIVKTDRAFNVPKNMKVNVSINSNDKLKNLKIPLSNQFQLTIDKFCNELLHKKNKFNFEQDLIEQAIVLDAARKSTLKNRSISINL